jgi:solute carrier family 25 phosphate transporter 3
VLGSLPAIWIKTVPYTMFQLPLYDVTSSALRDAAAMLLASGGVAVPPILIQLPASFVAAFAASLVSQPGDTLLSTINKGSARKMLAAGAPPCISDACGSGDFDVAVAVGDSMDPYPDDLDGDGDEDTSSSGQKTEGGLWELAATLGPAGLMVGWSERLVHVSSVVIIQLICYDNIKHALLVGQ